MCLEFGRTRFCSLECPLLKCSKFPGMLEAARWAFWQLGIYFLPKQADLTITCFIHGCMRLLGPPFQNDPTGQGRNDVACVKPNKGLPCKKLQARRTKAFVWLIKAWKESRIFCFPQHAHCQLEVCWPLFTMTQLSLAVYALCTPHFPIALTSSHRVLMPCLLWHKDASLSIWGRGLCLHDVYYLF